MRKKQLYKAYYLYSLNVYDIENVINQLKEKKIKIYHLKKIDDYSYQFIASVFVFNRLHEIYPNIKILKSVGILSIFINAIKYKTTIIALILSVAFYFLCSSRIWKINITGDYESLNVLLKQQLTSNNIYVGHELYTSDEISAIQSKILYDNFDKIEYLSIKQNGSVIYVNFKKKRDKTENPNITGNLYASRDGMIKSFDLLRGEKVVEINDYVKKGDLLVKDVVTSDYGKQIYVGTFGSVYAYTWYYTTYNYIIKNSNEAEVFANALMESRHQISINFSENEYIYDENVLQFYYKNDEVYLRVHFTCVENIARS